jgi:hypothetical protein
LRAADGEVRAAEAKLVILQERLRASPCCASRSAFLQRRSPEEPDFVSYLLVRVAALSASLLRESHSP